jgi:hypothetical protein
MKSKTASTAKSKLFVIAVTLRMAAYCGYCQNIPQYGYEKVV